MIYLTTSSTYTPQKVLTLRYMKIARIENYTLFWYENNDQNVLSLSFHDDSELLKAFK